MNRTVIKGRAEDALLREIDPGEYVVGGAAVTSVPTRWLMVALLATALALCVANLEDMFVTSVAYVRPLDALAVPLLLTIRYLPRALYVAATNQRLLCLRLSRLSGAPQRLIFAVPLADVRVVKSLRSKHRALIRCEIPGPTRIQMEAGRAWLRDFTDVSEALEQPGSYMKLEPPWPSTADS